MKVIIHDIPLLSGGWRKLAFADSTVLKETLYFLETCEPHNSALNKTDINIAGSNKLNDYYIYTSISEVISYLEEQAKEHALSKLSELEKHLLGLNKEVVEVKPVEEQPEIKIGGFYKIKEPENKSHNAYQNYTFYEIYNGSEFKVLDVFKTYHNWIVVEVKNRKPEILPEEVILEHFLEVFEEVPF